MYALKLGLFFPFVNSVNPNHLTLMALSSPLGEAISTKRVLADTWKYCRVGGRKWSPWTLIKDCSKSLLLWNITTKWAPWQLVSKEPIQSPIGAWIFCSWRMVFGWGGMEFIMDSIALCSLLLSLNLVAISLMVRGWLLSKSHISLRSPFLSSWVSLFLENPNPIPWTRGFYQICVLRTWYISCSGEFVTCSNILFHISPKKIPNARPLRPVGGELGKSIPFPCSIYFSGLVSSFLVYTE